MKLLTLAIVLAAACIVNAQVQIFTDETLYLAAMSGPGYQALIEDFEGSDWDGVRNVSAPSVTSKGITWTGTDQITTGEAPARTGWAIYDHPGGDPDILYGSSNNTLYGIGGWFKTSTPYTNIQIYLDSALIPDANITLGTQYVFLGVIDTSGFVNFEIRDTEATPGDQKHWFADDFTFAMIPADSIPTLSEWGMLILALLLLAFGTAAILKRRKAAVKTL